jgi:hypothetical protein
MEFDIECLQTKATGLDVCSILHVFRNNTPYLKFPEIDCFVLATESCLGRGYGVLVKWY